MKWLHFNSRTNDLSRGLDNDPRLIGRKGRKQRAFVHRLAHKDTLVPGSLGKERELNKSITLEFSFPDRECEQRARLIRNKLTVDAVLPQGKVSLRNSKSLQEEA